MILSSRPQYPEGVLIDESGLMIVRQMIFESMVNTLDPTTANQLKLALEVLDAAHSLAND